MAAQYPGEDAMIRELVGKGAWGMSYLDIGAFHPVTLSNTYGLYEPGWSGDVFEPLPRYAEEFQQMRPRDRYHCMAVSDHSDGQEFWTGGNDGALSTMESDWVARLGKEYSVSPKRIPTIDAAILEGRYSFGSLDVEGHEATIINRMDFDRLRVGVWMIEAIEHRTFRPTYLQWEETLLSHGYEYRGSVNSQNRFYRHQDYGSSVN